MKQLLILLALALPLLSQGQGTNVKEGRIIFAQKVNLHKQLEGNPRAERMKEFLPEFRTTKFELLYTENTSLYRAYITEEDDMSGGRGGMRWRMMAGGGGGTLFRNLETGAKVEHIEFMGKNFLVSDDEQIADWQITSDMMTIAGYPCIKAVRADTANNRTIAAWFTPAIPVALGPANFTDLPGMVIAVATDDNSLEITPVSIEFKDVDDDQLNPPKRGKEMTRTEFRELMRETMEQMREQNGGGQTRVMIRGNE